MGRLIPPPPPCRHERGEERGLDPLGTHLGAGSIVDSLTHPKHVCFKATFTRLSSRASLPPTNARQYEPPVHHLEWAASFVYRVL